MSIGLDAGSRVGTAPGARVSLPTDAVVVVTGAAGGIGRCMVDRLVVGGHVVAALDAVGDPSVLRCDVRDGVAVEQVVTAVEDCHGPVTHLVHAAGVLRTGDILALDEADQRAMVEVNVLGTMNVLRAVGRRMQQRERGSIVVVTSNAARVPRTEMAAYAASKAASEAYARCLGLALAPHGVRVNCVAPGSTRTSMLTDLWDGADRTAETVRGAPERHRLGIPIGRLAEPEDVACAAEFLLGDEARHVTLQTLTVDGGAGLGV